MSEQFRAAVSDDFFTIIEDAILAGGFDQLVLERVAMIASCKARRPIAQRRCRHAGNSQN